MSKVRLIEENFMSLPIGYLPSDPTATGEYHYYVPGHTSIWYEPNKDNKWPRYFKSGKAHKNCWIVRERNGRHEMEQTMVAVRTTPLLVTGDTKWKNYSFHCKIWPLSLMDKCGIVMRYSDSRHYYYFALEGGSNAVFYRKHEEDLIELAKTEFAYNSDNEYEIEVYVRNNTIACMINGNVLMEITDDAYLHGKVGIAASAPTRFLTVLVEMEQSDLTEVNNLKTEELARIQEKERHYPKPLLWKTLDLHNFGAGRSIRYSDLTGNGEKDLIFVQNMWCLNSGDECMISCITAIDLDGNMLWQIGEPHPDHGMITADVPIQIYDLDGDGFNEVIYCKDFQIIVADGRTGKTKYAAPTPKKMEHETFTVAQNITFERIIGDSIRICNFSGNDRPTDLLVKDRYNNLWVYDRHFNLLWHQHVNSGHFPYSYDMNGDGKDELVAGYSLISSAGEFIWQLPDMIDHVDEIAIGRFDPNYDKQLIAMACGEDGFLLVDEDGRIVVQDKLGHAQRVSVGNYRPDLPGLEYCVTTFWRNTGIIVYYDCTGNRIYSCEPGANGNVITPVNWTGDGSDLILYSANTRYGGMFDGHGDKVVSFPNDGHPDLTCDAVNLCGDEREELLVWDTKRMYIYTQEDSPKEVQEVPRKYPDYNFSNYRGEFSIRGMTTR